MVSEFGLSSMLLVMVVPTAGLPLMYLQVVYGPPTGELTYSIIIILIKQQLMYSILVCVDKLLGHDATL